MVDRETAPLLKAVATPQTNKSPLIFRLAVGGFLLGLLFVSLGVLLLYVPRPEAAHPEEFEKPVHPAAPHPFERDLLSQVALDLLPFNNSDISSGISLQQVERVYCNFDQVRFCPIAAISSPASWCAGLLSTLMSVHQMGLSTSSQTFWTCRSICRVAFGSRSLMAECMLLESGMGCRLASVTPS